MRCTNCGAELKPGALFCTSCGAKAAPSQQQQQQKQGGYAQVPYPGKAAGTPCPVCGTTIPEGYAFCTGCGTPIGSAAHGSVEDRSAVCWSCGAAIRPDLRFCTNCGADQSDEASSEPTMYEAARPEKKRHTGLWITLICILLAAIAAVAVLFFTGALDDMLGIDSEQSESADDEDDDDDKDSDSSGEDAKNEDDKEEEGEEEEPEESPAPSESPEPEPDYLLPDSATRYLTEADLESLTWRELCLARNEIFARHGRRFQTPEIASYFESKDWYEARYNEVTLSSIETANVNFIINYEKEHYGGSYY